MKRILILTDSLGLPREGPQIVEYENTWPYLLKKNLGWDVIQSSIGAATSSDLLNQLSYYKNTKPDLIFVQCGVVDLTPRAFLPFEISFLSQFRVSRYVLNRVTKNKDLLRRIRKYRGVTYTSVKKFEANLRAFKKTLGDSVYWVTVPARLERYDELVPGVVKNIEIYNEIILKVFGENAIDVSSFSYEEVMSDFHHLRNEGHSKLYKKIIDQLKSKNAI